MRICLVYDCLYPHTIGGAERWYRNLSLQLAAAGHHVTYLTRQQWAPGDDAGVPGVEVIAVSPGGPLYTRSGRRRISPPLRFGLGLLRHLVVRRRLYEVVHTASFPFFSVLAIRLALLARSVTVAIDWFEVWTKHYWVAYLGCVGGRIGYALQRLCVRLTPLAFVFSDLHDARLRKEGLRSEPVRLPGLYSGPTEARPGSAEPRKPLAVYVGRHIPEKRVELVAAAIATARPHVPDLKGLILGDGPTRGRVLTSIAKADLGDVVDAPGFVSSDDVAEALAGATCLVLPSSREGYGFVVIEAAAAGTPSIVVESDDNAAVELIDHGVNGFLVPSSDPKLIANAIIESHEAGEDLRAKTVAWFETRVPQMTAEVSARRIADLYASCRPPVVADSRTQE